MGADEMTRANWENLCGLSLALGSVRGGSIGCTPELSWSYTGRPGLNRILGARFPALEAAERVARVTQMVRDWQIPTTWLFDPQGTPDNLGDYLEEQGWFNPRGAGEPYPSWTHMALPLDAPLAEASLPEGVTIARVPDHEALRAWTGIFYTKAPSPVREAIADIFCDMGCAAHRPWAFYLAYVQGKPVASSMLFRAAGVAGLYFIGTLPDFRRQGIGTAITRYTLQQAQQMGANLAVLQATVMGAPIYRALGFTAYGEFRFLNYRPPV
jgi:ribosomal protein S18 acetylase RimI-like enzyme